MSTQDYRIQSLLLFLSKSQEYVTSKELVDLLDVSQKTIYRLIKKINDGYEEGPLILAERGRGYKLDYEKYIHYQKDHLTNVENDFQPHERRKRIMEKLLFSSPTPINIYNLFSEYYVGESVVFSDVQIMSEELKAYNLSLKRKNRTLAIIGEEIDVRKAIKGIIEIFHTIDIDDLQKNKALDFNKYDVMFILRQLRSIEKELDSTIPYPYNVNIFSHLYILLSRFREVPALLFSDTISQQEILNMKKDVTLYPVAEKTVNNIEKYINGSLPNFETYFLYQYLVSSRMQEAQTKTVSFSPEVTAVTQAYIERMSINLGIDIASELIFVDLANHIKPLLNRLEYKIRIKNSLLDQIKITYEEVFSQVTNASEYVSEKFDLPAISEDENGFIALYFAKVLVTGKHRRPIKTLIMCTTGVGTSELLKAKVSKKFPELEIIDVVASQSMKVFQEKYREVELILSTIHVNEAIPIPNLLVSAMFTVDDQKRLQRIIEEIYHEE